MNKIIVIPLSIFLPILIIVGVLSVASDKSEISSEIEEIENSVDADVIMPTKVSRPGCEEIDRCYIPSTVNIVKGETVTWLNEDSAFHSVTSGFYDEPTGLFDSGYMEYLQSFSYTFDDSGVFDYYCTLHPWMKAQVVVE